MWDIVVIGCGLSGMVAARKMAESGKKVLILEKRKHIGGNIYDETDCNGFLIQKYGPHCFFTNNPDIQTYVEQFVKTEDCFVECKTIINGMEIPMPFNFQSIDMIYEADYAAMLKNELLEYFEGKEIVAVTDLLNSANEHIESYGKYMYENEYKLYSAKQWGRGIEEISPEVFKRVPVYLSYKKEYQSHAYQFLPDGGFTVLSKKILEHENIRVELCCDVIGQKILKIENGHAVIEFNNQIFGGPILFTGELDALFEYKYGHLPYRSLEFVWKVIDQDEFQDTAIVAYPQADKITRVTEYKKLPLQWIQGKTEISIEIPLEYNKNAPVGNEPYYPIKNKENDELYKKYYDMATQIDNLYLCGRLADYKYYNMDMAIQRSWDVTEMIFLDNS